MTEARLVIDLDSGVAAWRQIRDQLVRLIANGTLPVGSPLPPIRQVATDLGLAPGTVARVYRELETNGIVHTARRHGTIVAALPPPLEPATDTPHLTAILPAGPAAATSGQPPPNSSHDTANINRAAPALAALAADYVTRAVALGASPDAIMDAVQAAIQHRDRVAGEPFRGRRTSPRAGPIRAV